MKFGGFRDYTNIDISIETTLILTFPVQMILDEMQ